MRPSENRDVAPCPGVLPRGPSVAVPLTDRAFAEPRPLTCHRHGDGAPPHRRSPRPQSISASGVNAAVGGGGGGGGDGGVGGRQCLCGGRRDGPSARSSHASRREWERGESAASRREAREDAMCASLAEDPPRRPSAIGGGAVDGERRERPRCVAAAVAREGGGARRSRHPDRES